MPTSISFITSLTPFISQTFLTASILISWVSTKPVSNTLPSVTLLFTSKNKLFSDFKNFAERLSFIVASSTTVPKDRSPSATTIVALPPLAITPTGEHTILIIKRIKDTNNKVNLIIFKLYGLFINLFF